AEEARIMGLVNRVVTDDKVGDVALETAKMISANAPMTVASVKYIIGQTVTPESERDLAECDARVKACFDSADYIEGRRAFLEKRKPQFVGA
ncbi:MAG: enoyl-CoA hydratase-related protein, partial [Pseudomonadota bacterium]